MLTKEISTRQRIQPNFIEPMQIAAVRQLPDGGLWSYEAKLDGYRCLAAKREGRVALWSRRGNSFKARFPAIARVCEKLPPDTLIDGKVIAIDENGKISFNALQHSRPRSHIQFFAFDILVHRSRNVLGLPLESRRELLLDALAKVEYPVLVSQAFDAKPADLIRAAKELELEGIIAKRKGSLYEPGRRSGTWVKYKINRSQEFVVGGYTPGNPFDALSVYDGADLQFVAKVRNGFVPALRRDVYQRLKVVRTEKCPFTNLPEKRRTLYSLTKSEMENCQWLKPEFVAQIEFTEWTPDGHLRHSSFVGLRSDKYPYQVIRE